MKDLRNLRYSTIHDGVPYTPHGPCACILEGNRILLEGYHTSLGGYHIGSESVVIARPPANALVHYLVRVYGSGFGV